VGTGDLQPILKRALDLDQPSLIEVPVDYRENLHLAERLGRAIASKSVPPYIRR